MISDAVTDVIDEVGDSWGYRHVRYELRINRNMFVTNDQVMHALRGVDPDGVRQRRPRFLEKRPKRPFVSNGPNFLLSLDGHDKLAGYQCSMFDLKIYG